MTQVDMTKAVKGGTVTTAAELLRMIETVDPSDSAKLDEIDARVWCYLLKVTFHHMLSDYEGDKAYRWSVTPKEPQAISQDALEYTRSRDALKAIRPDGYWLECNKICNGTFMAELHNDVGCVDDDEGITHRAWYLKTEELAELHAIIQAIDYERINAAS